MNADDERCYRMKAVVQAPLIYLVSENEDNPLLQDHLSEADTVIFLRKIDSQPEIIYKTKDEEVSILSVEHIPATLNGMACHNISNALFAAATAIAMQVELATIKSALYEFTAGFDMSPGPN